MLLYQQDEKLFHCCSDSGKRIIFFRNVDTLCFFVCFNGSSQLLFKNFTVKSNSLRWLDSSSNFFNLQEQERFERFFTFMKVILAAVVSNFSINGGLLG